MLPAGAALLAGLYAALLLLGVRAPALAARLPQVHGMLLVYGFVGTLVAVERAVALRRRAGFTARAATRIRMTISRCMRRSVNRSGCGF